LLSFRHSVTVIAAAAMLHETLPDLGFSLVELGAATILLAFILQRIWPRWAFTLILKTSRREVAVLTSRKGNFVFWREESHRRSFYRSRTTAFATDLKIHVVIFTADALNRTLIFQAHRRARSLMFQTW
jgi:hypothetical protein